VTKKISTEEVEDVKVLRRLVDKERTLQRRQARWTKTFTRTNG
jgi:hypothetical protein